MLDKYKILSDKDPILGKFISMIGELDLKKTQDYYTSLLRSIIGQQLSAKAAATIFARFTLLTNGDFTPSTILSLPDEEIRGIGISYPKIKYMKNLSQKVLDKEIDFDTLDQLDNQTVIAALTNVKGIGKWTAEMFLIFSLGRENVLSLLDVGLQRGAKWLYNSTDEKILEIKGQNWEPYQSIVSLYLWEAVNRSLVTTYKSFDDYIQTIENVSNNKDDRG
ncbi:DNA-3-methyladenine glycosylase family protein [Neobacillus mesonae]|uniref:DNA-3-methyladenine glycosylase family protein n=1 Tax=Neobacillus mesonae TaxID=1193713 RepID=UPI002572B0DC|nr:DNA-3-methyladenine glycosylase 2 family protein [Neobacillus mesonae]